MKHPEHICRFNDEPQTCECYDAGFDAGRDVNKTTHSVDIGTEDNNENTTPANDWRETFSNILTFGDGGDIDFQASGRKIQNLLDQHSAHLVEMLKEELELSCVDDRLLGKSDEYLEGYNTSTARWRKIRDNIITNFDQAIDIVGKTNEI